MRRLRVFVARALAWLLRPALEPLIDGRRLSEPLLFGPADRLQIDPSTTIWNATLNTSSGRITIERDVFFGHSVMVLTGAHDVSRRGRQRHDWPRDGHDIVIEEGAWIASAATIIGPCQVGRHAVVCAGAVVTRDVAPETMVGGVPARVIRHV